MVLLGEVSFSYLLYLNQVVSEYGYNTFLKKHYAHIQN